MPARSRDLLAAAIGLALVAGTAQAKVTGFCSHEGRRVDLVDGAAWWLPVEEDDEDDYYDDESPPAEPAAPLMLAFVTFPLDAGALARATDRDTAIRDQSWKLDESARLELTLQDDAVGQQYLWLSPGTNISYSSNEVGHYTAGKAAAGHVAGSYRFSPEDGQDLTCEIAFDLVPLGDPADAPPPPGVALPPGGGEPGRTYLALNQAMRTGNLDAMAKLLPPERAAELQQARTTPEFAAQLEMMQALTPDNVRITGGRQDGDRAWLEFTATEGGQPRAGTAELKRESGRWIMINESTRDPD